jgi:hypothetical protein
LGFGEVEINLNDHHLTNAQRSSLLATLESWSEIHDLQITPSNWLKCRIVVDKLKGDLATQAVSKIHARIEKAVRERDARTTKHKSRGLVTS